VVRAGTVQQKGESPKALPFFDRVVVASCLEADAEADKGVPRVDPLELIQELRGTCASRKVLKTDG
jgi:hypothetical protein